MTIRTSVLVLLMAGLVPVAADAQSVQEYAERVQRLVELRDEMLAVADSGDLAVSRAGGLDSIRVGRLLLYTTQTHRDLVQEAGVEIWALLDDALGPEVSVFDSVSIAVAFSNTVVVSPQVGDRTRLAAYVSVARADRVRQTLLYELSDWLTSRLDSTVRSWAGFTVRVADTVIDWQELWVELATAASPLVDACETGGEPECLVALGMVPVDDPVHDWYDAEGRRELVRGLADNYLQDREAVSVCVERRWDQICVAVLQGLDNLPPPLSYQARQAFLRFALSRSAGGFGRLLRPETLGDSSTLISRAVADVAQQDLATLTREWRNRIAEGRPNGMSVGVRTTASTVVWIGLLVSIRLLASRRSAYRSTQS